MDEVELVKQKIDIVDLIGEYVSLKRAGRNFKGLCPFHGEKSPSFMVSPEMGIYKCFGCQKGGDCFSFIQEIEGVEFGEAIKILADRAGVKLEKKFDKRADEKSELIAIQEMAADYYHFLLTRHVVGEEAREYLRGRKITDKLIEQFRIGFALESWEGLKKYLEQKKKVKMEVMKKTGLVVEGSKGEYDRFRGRVIFPLADGRGRVIAFAGRVMPGARDDEPKYINSPETVIYHKSETLFGFFQAKPAIKKADRVVIVEGELDMISSFAAGVGETVAIKGSALTEEQVQVLSRLTKNLVLALDADSAGQEAMKRGIEIAERAGMNLKVVLIEGGKDPDDIARNSPGKWKEMLSKAVDVYEFYIRSGLANHDVKTVEGKRRFSGEVLPVLARIENQVVKSFYVRRVAGLLEVDEESVAREMSRSDKVSSIRPARIASERQASTTEPRNRQEKLEEELLAMILAADKETSLKFAEVWLREKISGSVGKIVERWWRSKGEKPVVEFIKGLEKELQTQAQTAYLKEIERDGLEREWAAMIGDWERQVARLRLGELTAELKSAEAEGREDKVGELEGEVIRWTKALRLANNKNE